MAPSLLQFPVTVRFYQSSAVLVLVVHVLWIVWVVVGCLLTRKRPLLRWFHILSLVYSILIEIFLWPCPLTHAEQWLQTRAEIEPYEGGFLIHYLEAFVYPDVSQELLTWCAVSVCLFNLGVYAFRFWPRQATSGGAGHVS